MNHLERLERNKPPKGWELKSAVGVLPEDWVKDSPGHSPVIDLRKLNYKDHGEKLLEWFKKNVESRLSEKIMVILKFVGQSERQYPLNKYLDRFVSFVLFNFVVTLSVSSESICDFCICSSISASLTSIDV